MDYGIQLASSVHHGAVVKRAEELGFTHAWFNDTQLLDADLFVAMTAAAIQTSKITLCTGVLIPSNRIAPAAACALASLNELAPGRIAFGVSTGHTARRTMGLKPVSLARMEEYILMVQALLGRQTVDWCEEGATHRIRFLNPEAGLINTEDPIPLHISAFGPKARALTAKLGAGWIGGSGNPAAAANALDEMRAAWQGAGRDPGDLYSTNLGSGCVLAAGESADSPRAKAQAGPSASAALHMLAETGNAEAKPSGAVAAALECYRAIHGSYPEAERHLANHRGHGLFLRPEEAPLITGEVIRALTRTGTRAELVQTVRQVRDAGFSQFGIQLRHGHEVAMLEDWANVFEHV